MTRLDRAGAAAVNVLRVVPAAGDPGFTSPSAYAEGLAAIWRRHLGPVERLTLASAALWSLDAEDAEALAEAALGDLRRGPPVPPFNSVKAEAELWASYASPAERKWYLVACWNALAESDRQAFMRRAA